MEPRAPSPGEQRRKSVSKGAPLLPTLADEASARSASASIVPATPFSARSNTSLHPSFENPALTLYNHKQRNALPDATSKPSPTPPPRRWTIFAAALLLFALALVVIYTSHRAFSSPLALVVVAAIGMAALLLQLRLRKNQDKNSKDISNDARSPVRSPLWLNILGVAFALAALAADILHWTANAMLVAALGAVVCFAISATAVLHSLRKK